VPQSVPPPEKELAHDGVVAQIDRGACLELLSDGEIGRVAVTMGAVPAVFPVNYAMLDGDVVFCTGRGTELDAAIRNAVVAFEVDDIDLECREGWSVLVVGVAREITDDARRARAEALPLQLWAPGSPEHVVAIHPELVSGRRIAHRVRHEAGPEMGAPVRP
jgi:nitroimidazol reductase NimA-like FMN-containing flavoprotein (pyridoxamine 5'-phosphate oxidase superfamily)